MRTASSPSARTAWLARRSVEIILDCQAASGAFIAAPAFPQYRYAWLRDGAFIAHAVDAAGRRDAGARFHEWVASVVLANRDGLERAIAAGRSGRAPASTDHLHCRYAADGSPGPDDWPTFQLDGPGIWLWSLRRHVRAGGRLTKEQGTAASLVGRYLAALWQLPSYDAWEEAPEHVHTSTLGAIAAGLRAAAGLDQRLAEQLDPVAEAIVVRLLERAQEVGHFTKWEGSQAVDASLLWLGMPYELVPLDHPHYAATVRRIEEELVSPAGGVHRYRRDTYYGGGEWILLTASLGSVYARRDHQDDRSRAERLRAWIEAQADADGSLPEQVAARALDPARIEEWRHRWGQSARPLAWSHAMYLLLLRDLGRLEA